MADTESTGESQPAGEQEETQSDELSLRDALAAAFDQVEAEERDAEAEVTVEEAAQAEQQAAAGTEEAPKRDPATGKFIKKEGSAEAAEQQPERDKSGEQKGSPEEKGAPEKAREGKEGEQQQADPAQAKAREAPANWSEADKARLKLIAEKAGPEAAQWLLDRHKSMEADYTRKTQALADFSREYGPVDQMFRPHLDRLKAGGYTPRTLIQAWASVENELMSGDPKRQLGIVRGIVTQYKLDPAGVMEALGLELPPGAKAGAGAAAADPGAGAQAPTKPGVSPTALQPWMEELQGVKSWIAQQQEREKASETAREQEAQRRREEQLGAITKQIEDFRTAKDEKGTLKHPYFDEVEQDMSLLAQQARASGKVLALDELYDRALYANPSTRAKALAAAQAAQRAKDEDEARARAAKARKAGSSVTGAPTAGQAPAAKPLPKDATLRQTLDEAFRQHSES